VTACESWEIKSTLLYRSWEMACESL